MMKEPKGFGDVGKEEEEMMVQRVGRCPSVCIIEEELPEYSDFVRWVGFLAKKKMSNNDASHDCNHLLRVLKNADLILKKSKEMEESVSMDQELVRVAALLHDIVDHKYLAEGQNEEEEIDKILSLVRQKGQKDEVWVEKLKIIITSISFTKCTEGEKKQIEFPEFDIVQDADRLDAIGAIGIGRCFTYGGAHGSSLYDKETPHIDQFC